MVALSAVVCYIMTFYYKVITRKGMFIFNPCHMTLIVMICLMISPSTPFMKKVHTFWTTWLFGAFLALFIPHLEGISNL